MKRILLITLFCLLPSLVLAQGGPNFSGGGSGGIKTAAGVVALFSSCSGTQYLGADGACHTAGSSNGTVTSVGLVGTANQLTVTGTSPITTSGSWTLSIPAAVILGTDNSAGGSVQLANGAAAAHTILSSGATTTNTIAGFTVVPVTGHLVDCTSASTTCTLHDSGIATAAVVTSATGGALTLDQVGSPAAAANFTITATNIATFSGTASGALPGITIKNTNNGSGAQTVFNMNNDAAHLFQFYLNSSTNANPNEGGTYNGNGRLTFWSNGTIAGGWDTSQTFFLGTNTTFASDPFSISSAGKITKYNGSTTAGVGVPFVLGVSNVTNQTASQTSVNLVASTPAAGSYIINYYADEKTACATVASGGVTFTFSWTDGTLARSVVTTILSADTTDAAADFVSGTIPIFSATASAVSYISTYTAGCTTGGPFAYDLHAWVTEAQ